ncbi:MAG: hypothetical protein IIX81_03630, partial [Tidjanibacter sp.]|nr:hypothetical protein [Tidjanibacter sp.]
MIKRVAGCLILVVTLFSCTVAVPPQNSVTHSPFDIPEWFDNDTLRATYLYTEGVRVGAESGSDTTALPYLYKALEIDSLHAPSHHHISLIEISTNPASALAHSQIAHAADTANIDYLGQLAYAQLVGRQHKTALQNYNKLLRLDSRNPYNYRVAAALYVENNMPYMAVAVLDSAEYKLGFVPELWNDKRNLLLDLKLYDRAIEETLSVVANHPYESDNYRVLADLYARTGNDSLAVVNFDKAVSMAPDHFGTLLSAAKYHLSVGNERKYLAMLQSIFGLDSVPLDTKISLYDNAISEIEFYRRNFYAINTLNSVLRIKHPDSWEITERYATHLIRAGELDQALVVYKKELQKPTAGAEAYSAVVDIESYLGRRDSVMHYLNRAIEKFPTNERLNLYRAYELQQADASEKTVVAAYKKYIKVATDGEAKSSGCAALGDYYYAIGKPKECFRWYTQALDYNPDNALTLNNWAYFISELIGTPTTLSAEQMAELERALAMSVRACELSP